MDEDIKLLRKLEILQLIENLYTIEIKDEEIEFIVSIEDLLNLIENKLG